MGAPTGQEGAGEAGEAGRPLLASTHTSLVAGEALLTSCSFRASMGAWRAGERASHEQGVPMTLRFDGCLCLRERMGSLVV